ncbi:YciI family protein [Phenylobacterium aquaticum]|uniref:YciI family protein n=1 Tax=Phenylobacterium aquaticum TaxID=1763816 RepID=UPI0026EA0CB8|nr:YciI family protein [Phenylobacterium aquaticum]
MRFMFLIHSDSDGAPSPELMVAMHDLAQQEVAAGRMIADGGLFPPAMGAGLRVKSGKVVLIDGPYAETKEVIGGFAIFELPDMAAAQESARAFLDLHVRYLPGWEGLCEIRPIAGSQVESLRGVAPG